MPNALSQRLKALLAEAITDPAKRIECQIALEEHVDHLRREGRDEDAEAFLREQEIDLAEEVKRQASSKSREHYLTVVKMFLPAFVIECFKFGIKLIS